MLNIKCVIIQVKTGDSGIVTEGLRENFLTKTEERSVGSVQRATVLGASHVLQ
jgi:hypothetical protein